MKKIFALGIAILAFAACNMDFYSSDSMTSAQLGDNPSSAVYTTDGVYALFKDVLVYKGTSDGGNMYIRHLFQLSESRSDNLSISGHSTDPFLGPYRYEDVTNTKNKYYFWWIGYKIIYAANSNISAIDPNADKLSSHLMGENYFFRALVHFNFVSLFAMPYVCGRDNPGVVLRRSMDYTSTSRATVGACYDGIVEDLKEAIKYMDKGTPRGDASYVSATAARALLARVYLNMGDEHLQDCIDVCDELISKAPASVKGEYTVATLKDYPKATWSSPETIWCVHMIYPTDLPSTEATLGAMYYKDGLEPNNIGWGEWYWNDELIELFNRYPEDRRFQAYFTYEPLAILNNGKKMICFPEKPTTDDGHGMSDYCVTGYVKGDEITDNGGGSYSFNYGGKAYTITPQNVNGYTRYFINDNLTGDPAYFEGKTPAYIRDDIDETNGIRSSLYVRYYNTKFSFQDDQATFSSPVILRWGEVFLNRAEAYARLGGKDNEALADVNLIRHRAGLPATADFNTGNVATRGYASVLDVVLDERRMELCFEGDRLFSLTRNKKDIDRRYVGYHPFEVVKWNDPRMALLLPEDEINATDIKNNPR